MLDRVPRFPSRLSSDPQEVSRHAWPGGVFTTAYRPMTRLVEGEIGSSSHLIMATLRGGARRHEITIDDRRRYDGPDGPGSTSFLPAGHVRRLRLHGVEWRWAALALDPAEAAGAALRDLPPVAAANDGFIAAMLGEFERLSTLDGALDPLWCDSMVGALTAYLRRSAAIEPAPPSRPSRLAPWQLRRVRDHVEANLSGEIRTPELAALCRASTGHFHRAFRASTGETPLAYVTARRIERARLLLASGDFSVDVVAFQVGFVSPSHFARVFRAATGQTPFAYRRAFSARG